ncbi:hypothetical protein SAY86_009999 [Trapa natans]|uniref:Uncharacterized protein n=1 Tax=Trapa natans TaxID=22666 RepID=A0AAN7L0L8_TRANT|nr:hypothetical protein SAY86_009999 [Trapa natans]
MEDGLYGLQFGGCYVGDEELHSTRVHHPSPPPPPLLEADGGYEVNNHSHHFLPHHHYEGFPLSTAVASFDLPSSCQWMQTGNSTVISDAASRMAVEMEEEESVSLAAARAKIAAHPLYPKLVQAYIDCQKVGAPPEVADILEKIRRESEASDKTGTFCLGADPELDEFMEAYCDTLMRFKSDLSRPFEEATSFLKKVETQLNTLCKGSFPTTHISDEQRYYYCTGNTSDDDDDDLSGGDGEIEATECSHWSSEEREMMDKLMRKYSGYIGALKHEFSKKKKRGKLPKEARDTLLEWWNLHYKWPYPTEVDKAALAESTGLDQKQINNWFINQRKRHWKPSDSMHLSLMESLYGPFFPT